MLLALGALAGVAAAAPAQWAGRRVIEVVAELRAEGVNVLYSSDLVPDELRVEREPQATAGAALLAEVLRPHSLLLKEIAPGTYAVVAATQAGTAATAPGVDADPARVPTLEEIVVATSRYTFSADTPDVHVFMTQSEVESLPRLAEETLKAVQRLPGAAGNGVSGLAHVRGGAQDETLILFDGLPLHEPFHLRNALSPVSLLSARIVDSLDVHAGGFTAPHGDRMSAVIEAESVRPVTDRYHELGFSLFHTSALVARRFDGGRGQWLLSARRSNLHEISHLVEDSVAEPAYFDVFGRLDMELSDRTTGDIEFLVSDDIVDVDDEDSGEVSRARYENAYLWATLKHQWSDPLQSTFGASWTEVRSRRSGTVDQPGRRSGSLDDQRSYRVLGLRADSTWKTPRWLHSFGVDFRDVSAEYDYRSEAVFEPGYPFPGSPGASTTRELAPEPAGQHLAVYVSSRFRLTDRITAEAGLRWDNQNYNTAADADDQVGPRLNLVYALDDATRLRASWGRYQQFQDINELQVEDGVVDFAPAQSAEHAIVSLEHEFAAGTAIRVEAYRKRYDDLRPRFENLFDPVAWLPELAADRIMIAPEAATARGIEVLVTHRGSGPWSGWLGYSWSEVTDRVEGREVLRSWDQTHAVNAGINWSKSGWDLTLAGAWHTGWPTTPVGLSTSGAVVVGPRNSERFPSFSSIDLRASRRFDVARGELSAFFEVTNVFDRNNPCCVEWTTGIDAGGATTLSRRYDHWLPRVPSFGVLWKF